MGNLEGIFRGFFLTHRTKAQKLRRKFRSIFRKKIRGSKKIFRAKFTLQTCHLNLSESCQLSSAKRLDQHNSAVPKLETYDCGLASGP